MEIIGALHPPGTVEDILPDEDMPPAAQIDESDILKFGKQCNEESAGGCSGWTFALIKAILNIGTLTQRQETAKDFTALGNYVLSGSIPDSLKDLWYDGRAAILPKPDGGYRALGIGEALYRMFTGCAVKKVSKKTGEALLPFQLAVGVSGGVEIGARTAQLSFDYPGEVGTEGMALASLDITNAYNTQRRIDAYKGLKEYCPGLVRLFKSKYGRANTIRNAKGEVVGHSHTGTSQGDPFATLSFTCGLQPLIQELNDTLHEESRNLAAKEDANPEAHPYMANADFHRPQGSVQAVADDITFSGRTVAVLAVCARAPAIFAKYGFKLTKEKSKIIGKMAPYLTEAHDDPELEGFEILDTGCKILGRPVGTVDFQKHWLGGKLAKRAPPAEASRRISAKILYRLLYFCYNARPSYLAAVLDKDVSHEALELFDKSIDSVLAEKLRIDPDNQRFQTLRSLPWRLGGKGMRRHSGPLTEKAILISRARTCEYLQKNNADLYHQIREHNERMWPAVRVGSSVGKVAEAAPQNVGIHIHTVEDAKSMATSDLRKVEKSIYDDIRSSLTQITQQDQDMATVDTNKELAAWHLSTSVYGSARWAIAPMYLMRLMTDNEFIENMRLSLLCRYQDDPGPCTRRCTCSRGRNASQEPKDLNRHPTHPLICLDFKNLERDRHDAIRDLLARKLKQSYTGATVTIEHLMEGAVGDREFRTDVCFRLNHETRFIEISVACPSAASYIENARSSSITTVGGAAMAAEERKTQQYIREIQGFQVQTLVPFIVESTGQLGPKAKLFIDTMFADTNTRSAIMTEISVIIAAFNGKMLHLARRRRPD